MATISEKANRNEPQSWKGKILRQWSWNKSPGTEYTNLVSDDEEASLPSTPATPVSEPQQPQAKGYWAWLKALSMLRYPLYISIIIHTLILIDLVYAHWIGRVSYGQYGNGFHTDFGKFSSIDLRIAVTRLPNTMTRVGQRNSEIRDGAIYALIASR